MLSTGPQVPHEQAGFTDQSLDLHSPGASACSLRLTGPQADGVRPVGGVCYALDPPWLSLLTLSVLESQPPAQELLRLAWGQKALMP